MSLVAGSAAQPGQARTHPLLPHVSVSLLHYIPPSKQLSITMIYVAAKEQERVSERVSESERGRERELELFVSLCICLHQRVNLSFRSCNETHQRRLLSSI